jgi:hypothetical protein
MLPGQADYGAGRRNVNAARCLWSSVPYTIATHQGSLTDKGEETS